MSRKNRKIALKTLAIGAQITTAPIYMISENFHKYEEKLEQMRAMVPFLESNQTQRDLKNRFGKLTTPDMMSYIALNGDLRTRSASKNAMKSLLALFFSLHPKCRKNWKKSTQKNPHNNAVFS